MKSQRSRNKPDPAPRKGPARAAPPLTVLHVDDDPNDTALLYAATRKAELPIRLQTVGDGEQAIAYLDGDGRYSDRRRYRMPELVLLDLKMPRASGFDVLKWIRSRAEFRSIPVVVLSGSELADDMRHAYENGANSYLVKPLAFDALVGVVRNIHRTWLGRSPLAP